MDTNEPDSIKDEDWRIGFVTTLAKDWVSPFTGVRFEKGCSIHMSGQAKFAGKNLSYPLPETTALFLSFSNKLFEETEKYLSSNFYKASNPKFPNEYQIPDSAGFYDFLEKRMASIVFAYSAIEAFANACIPDNYTYTVKRKDGKCTESYSRDQIERNINLDTKLLEILSQTKKKTGLKRTGLWNDYKNLQDLRDRIIHLKSNDAKSAPAEAKTLIGDLLTKKPKSYAVTAKKLIQFFQEGGHTPRWLEKIPF